MRVPVSKIEYEYKVKNTRITLIPDKSLRLFFGFTMSHCSKTFTSYLLVNNFLSLSSFGH